MFDLYDFKVKVSGRILCILHARSLPPPYFWKVRSMYDDLRLHQTYTEGNYFHLDIELKWLRGSRLHRDVRFKFFRDGDFAGLEFRSLPDWPVVFQMWPGHLVDRFGAYFVISTGDADRKAIAQLDPDGMTLVSDIAAELFNIISSLTNNPAAEVTDAEALLRDVIRVSDYIAAEPNDEYAHVRSTTGMVDGVSASTQEGDRPQLLTNTLRRIAAMLSENQRLLKELQVAASTANDFNVLDAYVAKIRLDGVPQHADMKMKLDHLAENNIAIVALIDVYAPHAKSAMFTSQADRFRRFASAWRDRWNSVLELMASGGHFSISGIAFPTEFAAAVDSEIAR